MSKHRFSVVILTFIVILVLIGLFTTNSSSQIDSSLASVTIGNFAPVVGSVTTYDNDGAPQDGAFTPSAATDWNVNCSAQITDNNGYSDVDIVNATLYHGLNSTYDDADDNDLHYSNQSCNMYGGSDLTINANCTFFVRFWADDSGDANAWICNITAWDTTDSGFNNASLEVASQMGFNVSSAIPFGTLNLGDTSSTDTNVSVGNLGNDGIDLQVNSSSTMVCSITGTIPVANIAYNSSYGNTYASMCKLGTDKDATCAYLNSSFDFSDCSDDCSNGYTEKLTYWKINIPASGIDGACTSTITFTAKDDGTG